MINYLCKSENRRYHKQSSKCQVFKKLSSYTCQKIFSMCRYTYMYHIVYSYCYQSQWYVCMYDYTYNIIYIYIQEEPLKIKFLSVPIIYEDLMLEQTVSLTLFDFRYSIIERIYSNVPFQTNLPVQLYVIFYTSHPSCNHSHRQQLGPC